MRKYRAFSAALVTSVPIMMMACAADDSDTPDTGGGSNGGGIGGKGGQGGIGQGGLTAGHSGSGGQAGDTGTEDDAGGDAGGAGIGGSGGMPPGECELNGEDRPIERLPADIRSHVTLTSGTTWVLDGIVKVHDGAELTIEPCTRIEGTPSPTPGTLFILRGGRINAVGTADEPIVFTTQSPVGRRSRGQWGSVVLLGNAPVTAATTSKTFHGLTDSDLNYGGTDPHDNSGTMRYVRIEFAGLILLDRELSGLTLGAVGSGTTLDHIMVTNIRDDCFEWWGGRVEANYLVCNNPGDDMFHTDEGYVATGRYWFGRRTGGDVVRSDNPTGFEWDGTESGNIDQGEKPRTNVTATNVTLCGTGASGFTNPEYGMVLRNAATGAFDNVAVLGFEYGIDTRSFMNNMFGADDFTMDNSAFWALANTVGAADTGTAGNNDQGFVDDSFVTAGTNNATNLDPAPFTLEDCQEEGGPTDVVKDSDIGAFAGDASWMNGPWADFAAN